MNTKGAIIGAIVLVFAIIFILIVGGANWAVRNVGGESELHLPADKKLVNATWKNSSVWLLTRPMKANEVPEVYDFLESSNLEIFEGTVHIIEHKSGGGK